MNEVYEKLKNLNSLIWEIYSYHPNQIKYMIRLLEQGLETICYIKSQKEVGKEELEIAITFCESILQMSKDASWWKYSKENQQRLYSLRDQMKQVVESVEQMKQMDVTYTDLNEWIQSLHICKYKSEVSLSDQFRGLAVTPYRTSYELYVDLRNAVMNTRMSKEEQIYIGKIIEKLNAERRKLSEDARIEVSDYELSELIRLMKDHPNFNFRLMWKQPYSDIYRLSDLNRFAERKMEYNKRKTLEYRLSMLASDEKNS